MSRAELVARASKVLGSFETLDIHPSEDWTQGRFYYLPERMVWSDLFSDGVRREISVLVLEPYIHPDDGFMKTTAFRLAWRDRPDLFVTPMLAVAGKEG